MRGRPVNDSGCDHPREATRVVASAPVLGVEPAMAAELTRDAGRPC